MPADMLEQEIFSIEEGSKLKAAEGGAFFLDEVADIPLQLQPQLASLLDKGGLVESNGTQYKADVRLLASTGADLNDLVEKNEFHSELLMRLSVLSLRLPSLRERVEDMPVIIERLLAKIAERRKTEPSRITDEAVKALQGYEWPRNIRELENVLERTSALAKTSVIDLPDLVLPDGQQPLDKTSTRFVIGGLPLEQIEKMAITETLEMTGGNKAEAARRLKISERSIYNKIKRLDIKLSAR